MIEDFGILILTRFLGFVRWKLYAHGNDDSLNGKAEQFVSENGRF